MNESKINSYLKKSGVTGVGAIFSFIGCIALALLSSGYSTMAENERRRDPEYLAQVKKREEEQRQLALQKAEADKQKYIYEQEKLKLEAENKKLEKEREKRDEALNSIKGFADNAYSMEDYERIDAAFTILDILKEGKFDEQVKYRALACLSELIRYSEGVKAEQKLKSIASEIEKL